ncbi:DEHA2D12672p [Debaryomyces hansenii CBS767]|uniref:DEHA2D12672p n=1 Tax=Debaryomyces hansenii (strain ATCC 36239 / CBS 767 / BCRC 21394 / JCM 1990 / NBRC 0083 / IGC 2968) TaxID=284592 RepID=Q6BRZ6_DEBHA|nr:DEHA2D12672p [Debaryomyces hansenii CBS767]CAG87192.2 DEHA2D12672p [Debaryomyces hansenii CBS767]|eukprot:XP_459024.2 DEHA2D12672p [Debaryomyces hansenii CBS767]
MNEASRDLVSQHPLYLAMSKCVEDELEMYDYRDFYQGWGVMTVDYRILIQEIFKVDNQEAAGFVPSVESQYSRFLALLELGYPQHVKRLFKLILSLPMCEYEIDNMNNFSSSGSKGSSNHYIKQFPYFRCSNNYLIEMGDDEVVITIRELFLRMEDKHLSNALTGFAFHEYELIPLEGALEGPFRDAFITYLIRPICKMLKIALDIVTKVETERPATWHRPLPLIVDFMCRTDIVISKGSLVYCVTEVKKYPLLPDYNGKPLDGIRSIFSDQKEIMKQLICEMLYFKTDKGILTDSYVVVFVELDLDSFERNVHNSRPVKMGNESKKIVPIKYSIRNCHSAKPTLRESLLAYIYKSVEEDSKMIIKQERVRRLEEHLKLSGEALTDAILSEESSNSSEGSGSRPSTRGTNMSVFESISEETEQEKEREADEMPIDVPKNSTYVLMQNSDVFNAQLVKLEAICFKRFLLESIDDNATLVAKVYDPRMVNRYEFKGYSFEEKKDVCYEWYRTERVCYSILSKDPEFNSCYVRQRMGQVMITMDKSYVAKGHFNLFRYIEKAPLPKDRETYEKARKQLEVIHRNGIVHRDIKEDNILCTKEGQVYIIDFALSRPNVNIYDSGSEQQDFNALERVFA